MIAEAASRDIWNGSAYVLYVLPLFSVGIGLLSSIILERYFAKPISKIGIITIFTWQIINTYIIINYLIRRKDRAEIEVYINIIVFLGIISAVIVLFLAIKTNRPASFVKMWLLTCILCLVMIVAGSYHYDGAVLALPENLDFSNFIYALELFYLSYIGHAFIVTSVLFASIILIQIIYRVLLLMYKGYLCVREQ